MAGEDTLSLNHAVNIFGSGFGTDEDHFFAGFAEFFGGIGIKYTLTADSAGGSGQTVGDGFQFGFRVDAGMEQLVDLEGIQTHQRFFFINEAFFNHIHGNFYRGGGSTFAVTGLKHEEFAAFHGELHILHIMVMVFQILRDIEELGVNIGHILFKAGDGLGSTDPGDNVFTLGVDEVFTEETFFTGGGVAGKGNAGTAVVAHVTEDHALYVNGGAEVIGDLIDVSVVDGAVGIPGAENGHHGEDQLFFGFLGEFIAGAFFVDAFEGDDEFFQRFGGELMVVLYAFGFFQRGQGVFKERGIHTHGHIAEHLDETAVAVHGEAAVAGGGGHAFDGIVIEAEIQNGVHHPGHGNFRAGTDGNKKRIFSVAQFFADFFFHDFEVFLQFFFKAGGKLFVLNIIFIAGFGGNGQTGRYGKADVGHFRKVRAFAP